MKNAWLGYVASGFLAVAGVLEIIGGNLGLGILFIALSVVSLIIRLRLNRKLKNSRNC